MKKILVFAGLLALLIQGCAKGGDSPPKTNNPTPPTPPANNSILTKSADLGFLGMADLSTDKIKTVTLTNTGTGATNNISVTSSGSSAITITTTCSTSMAVGQSCTVTAKLNSNINGGYLKTITITGGPATLSIPVYGYVYNNQEINLMISTIVSKQDALVQGSWDFLDSDLTNVTFIAHALAKADALSSVALYTPNIDFTSTPSSNWQSVDKALNFLMYRTDNTLLEYNPDNVSTDYDTTLPKWSNAVQTKPKQVGPANLFLDNEIYKIIYGTDLPNFSTLYDKYLDSRKIISVNGSNVVTGSTSSIQAQFAYLLDDNRWENFGLENSLKELDALFRSLNSMGKTTQIQELSQLMIDHWEYTLPEIQNLNDPFLSNQPPNIFNPIRNLKYNPNEFDYTTFIIPSDFNTDAQRNIQLWYSSDYLNQGYSCRNISYAVLNLVNAYKYGTWNSSQKAIIENFIKDGLIEIKQSYACKYNASSKKYTSQNIPTINYNNGLSVIFKIFSKLPDTIVPAQEKKELFDQIVQELNTGGSMDSGNTSQTDPLMLSEMLDIFVDLKN